MLDQSAGNFKFKRTEWKNHRMKRMNLRHYIILNRCR